MVIAGASVMLYKVKHPYPQLTAYVRASINRGKTTGQIRKELVTAGWPKEIVDHEISKYRK